MPRKKTPAKVVAKADAIQEQKGTFDMVKRTELYNASFDGIKQSIINQHNNTFNKNFSSYYDSKYKNEFLSVSKFDTDVIEKLKQDLNKITYQLDFVKYFYKHNFKQQIITIKKMKQKYIDLATPLLKYERDKKKMNEFIDDVFKKYFPYPYDILPFDIVIQYEKGVEQNRNKESLRSELDNGYIFHLDNIHGRIRTDNTPVFSYSYNRKNINLLLKTTSYPISKEETLQIFKACMNVFRIVSVLSYYVNKKYNHHFLNVYFFLYSVAGKFANNNERSKSIESELQILSEKYKGGIQDILIQSQTDKEQQKNIIVQCVLSIFSFHQYAKYYHNNTGNIDQAFVYNETIKPLNKKRYVKYILDDVVFFLEDMGYIVYIWGFNQGNKQIEKFENPNKQKILDDYLNFFNVQSLPQLFDKTKLSLDNQELTIITDPIMFEVKLVKIILGLLEYPIDDTNIPLEDAEIINKNYPCYLTMPSNVEFCFGVKTKSDSIVSVDTTKIEYKDNNILKFNSIEYKTTDKPNSKIKKYTNNNNTIYIIQHMDIPTLHIAYIISNQSIEGEKEIKFQDSEIKRIFEMYLSNLYDITKLLTG